MKMIVDLLSIDTFYHQNLWCQQKKLSAKKTLRACYFQLALFPFINKFTASLNEPARNTSPPFTK